MINQFAKDDPRLRAAINRKLYATLPWFGNNKNNNTSFNWSTFADENGLEDIEKLLGKIQTAYKNLEETGNGFALDSDILNAFPELANYLGDAEALKEKLQEIANLQIDPLVTQ